MALSTAMIRASPTTPQEDRVKLREEDCAGAFFQDYSGNFLEPSMSPEVNHPTPFKADHPSSDVMLLLDRPRSSTSSAPLSRGAHFSAHSAQQHCLDGEAPPHLPSHLGGWHGGGLNPLYLNPAQIQNPHRCFRKPYSQQGITQWVPPAPITDIGGSVVVPDERLKFPGPCCVGIASQIPLSIFNPTDRWQQGGISTASQSIDGQQVLLMDLPAPELAPDEKPLIDLSNTPDIIRTTSMKPRGGQLIDLSSPLIKWSPEDKKENVVKEGRLIDLSF
ncbi:uncharacterized protein LOC116218715 [Clupea harengus]|uniref:Uncharacterized protein LOC116218715 n=1 Tax=Clupea harengus TaxID=7950 RepID=A0A6P8EYI2_CLUHA|nr:uncharacterized protein LOC116218715 [Clupea harengus]